MEGKNHQDPWVDPEPGKEYGLSGRIMLSAIVILFAVVVFMVGLHVYARWYLVRLRRRQIERRRIHRRSEIVMYIDNRFSGGSVASDRGLDRTVLHSLPVILYSLKEEEPPLECAVCLSEFEEKEIVRHLPKCSHSFHLGCIDMWFRSHSTCPLCRSPVEHVLHQLPELVVKTAEPVEKTDGPEPGSSSSSEPEELDCNTKSLEDRKKGIIPAGVRIDVPPRMTELESELTLNSPVDRFLSLKRILSMGRRSQTTTPSGTGTSIAACELDLEIGLSESTRCPSDV